MQRGTRLPSQKGYSLSEENTPFENPRERRGESPSTPALAVGHLKSCTRCAIGCLLFFAAIRLDFLLSPAAALESCRKSQQSPPTSDIVGLATACRGSNAATQALSLPSACSIVDPKARNAAFLWGFQRGCSLLQKRTPPLIHVPAQWDLFLTALSGL